MEIEPNPDTHKRNLVTITLDAAIFETIDRLRGSASREDWIMRTAWRLSNEEKVPPTRIMVGLTPEESEEVNQLARECQTSPSRLGQIGIRMVLTQAKSGALPMVTKSTISKAEPAGKFTGIFDPLSSED